MSLHHVFSDVELWGSEIDQETVAKSGGFQIPEQLRDIRVRDFTNGLQLQDQDVFHNQVERFFNEFRTVLVVDRYARLHGDFEPLLFHAMHQAAFIDFLAESRAEIVV